MTDTANDSRVFKSYEGHGKPDTFLFHGKASAHPDDLSIVVTKVEPALKSLVFKDANDQTVATLGHKTKFWASPTEATKLTHEKASDKERAAKEPKAAKEPRKCADGCGGTTGGGTFLPGHDARFVKALKLSVKEGERTREQAIAHLSDMGGSDTLKAKLIKQLDLQADQMRRAESVAKAAKPDAAKSLTAAEKRDAAIKADEDSDDMGEDDLDLEDDEEGDFEE